MPTLIEAKAGMRNLALKAKEIRDDADLTSAEKLKKFDDLSADLKSYQDVISVHERAKSLVTGGDAVDQPGAPVHKSLAEQVTDSQAYADVRKSLNSRSRFSFSTEIGTKAATTVDEGTAIANGQLNGAAGVVPLPNYLPGIVDLRFAPLAVSSLLAHGRLELKPGDLLRERGDGDSGCDCCR